MMLKSLKLQSSSTDALMSQTHWHHLQVPAGINRSRRDCQKREHFYFAAVTHSDWALCFPKAKNTPLAFNFHKAGTLVVLHDSLHRSHVVIRSKQKIKEVTGPITGLLMSFMFEDGILVAFYGLNWFMLTTCILLVRRALFFIKALLGTSDTN